MSLELATPDIVECFEVIAMAGGLRKGQKPHLYERRMRHPPKNQRRFALNRYCKD
jgi:hypothetical protein